jgi:hypothetical protein
VLQGTSISVYHCSYAIQLVRTWSHDELSSPWVKRKKGRGVKEKKERNRKLI